MSADLLCFDAFRSISDIFMGGGLGKTTIIEDSQTEVPTGTGFLPKVGNAPTTPTLERDETGGEIDDDDAHKTKRQRKNNKKKARAKVLQQTNTKNGYSEIGRGDFRKTNGARALEVGKINDFSLYFLFKEITYLGAQLRPKSASRAGRS